MPLCTTKKLLQDAQRGGFAVGAFNVENMEMVQAVIAAAEKMEAPVILQTTPSTVKYAGLPCYYEMIKTAAGLSEVPVAIHLDHGNSFVLAMQALRAGYTSIMIDGSQKPLEDNIALTRRVVEACIPSDVPVEAELGKVGGKEDDMEGEGDCYTDPEDAFLFVKETGISSLAVAIGTAHGVYRGVPKLDLDRLELIRSRVEIPLVLHGASGVPDEAVRESISRGICKVNYATELRIAYSDGVKEAIKQEPGVIDPKKYGMRGREKVAKAVEDRMRVCGCAGRA